MPWCSPLDSFTDYLLKPECLVIASVGFVYATCILYLFFIAGKNASQEERAPLSRVERGACGLAKFITYCLLFIMPLVIAIHAFAAIFTSTRYYAC